MSLRNRRAHENAQRDQRRERRGLGEYATTGAVGPGNAADQQQAKKEQQAALEAAGVSEVKVNPPMKGSRYSATQKRDVKCDMAVNAIAGNAPIGKHGEYVRPICEWPSTEEFPLTMWDSPQERGFNGRKKKIRKDNKKKLIKNGRSCW